MNIVLAFLVRLLLLAAGLVFAAGLAVVFLLLALVAMLHAGWARLRGRPVTPFVFRVDPRAGFERFYRAGTRDASAVPAGARALDRRGDGVDDVTDVEPRRPGESRG